MGINVKERNNRIKESILQEDHIILSKKELKEKTQYYFDSFNRANIEMIIVKRDRELYWNIINSGITGVFGEKIYCILNDLDDRPLCTICNENYCNYWGYVKGFSKFCSISCSSNRPKKWKTKKTKLAVKLSDEEIIKQSKYYFDNWTKNKGLLEILVRDDNNLYLNILDRTKYLPEDCKFTERLYHVENNYYDYIKCDRCNEFLDIKFRTLKNPYGKDGHVCKKCRMNVLKDKRSLTLARNLRENNYDIHIKFFHDEEKEYKVITTKEEFINTGSLTILHTKCNNTYTRIKAYSMLCPFCNPKHKTQSSIARWLNKYTKVEQDKRLPLDNSAEIDIWLPDYNIGFEFDSLSYHTENRGGKGKWYHNEKHQIAEEKGIQLYNIIDYEYGHKRKIIKSLILAKLGIFKERIYARKCIVKEINTADKNEFLDNNHRQGADKSSVKLGLYHNDELVSVMTFGKRQISRKNVLELIRYCSKCNTQIIGGANKLFKYFINNYWDGEDIYSYADRRWSNGKLYEILGFELSHISTPNYWYISEKYNKIYHRVSFQKHKLLNKLKEFDSEMTEWENMKQNGWDRIWDSGNYVYIYKIYK